MGGGAARPAWLEGAALVHLDTSPSPTPNPSPSPSPNPDQVHLDGRHAEMALHAARLGLELGLELGLALHAARCAPLLSP